MLDEDEERVFKGYFESSDGLLSFSLDEDIGPLINNMSYTSLDMTIQKCLSICRGKKFAFAGLEWSYECYCGNEPEQGFKWAWPGKCSEKCSGDSDQICGGSRAMSVFSVSTDGVCIVDFPNTRRVLDRYSVTGDENMTIEACQDICAAKLTRYYGVENGDECYCGDSDEGTDLKL